MKGVNNDVYSLQYVTCISIVIAAPRLIVYDNACNLHSYSLNRDPVFFKNSQFLVDRLHWRDHTGIKHSLFSLIGHPDGLNKLMIIIIVCIFP